MHEAVCNDDLIRCDLRPVPVVRQATTCNVVASQERIPWSEGEPPLQWTAVGRVTEKGQCFSVVYVI